MKHPLITTLIMSAVLSGCGGGGGDDSAPDSGSLNAPSNTDQIEDDDNDGLSTPDEENIYGSDPNDPHDPVPYGQFDHDDDGTPNGADEDYDGNADSDNDGLSNDWEYSQSLDPAQAEILVSEERFFSVVTPEYSWIKLTLKTPSGDPIKGTAFSLSTDDPALMRAIYPTKGWVTDNEGVIDAPIIALGTGRSSLYLNSPERTGEAIEIANIDSSLESYTYNPADDSRNFSSIKNDSAPGLDNARSTLQSAAAWTPETKTDSEWIELPVEENTRVAALLVQGRADTAHWVSKVKISYEISPGHREYANDGFEFNANSDRNTLVRIPFNAPAGVSHIRVHPTSWFLTPAMRVGLEVTADSSPAAINTDSDNDGFNDLLEARIGSDANDNSSPRLHNPHAAERQFSSLEEGAILGDDGADGQLYANAWRPALEDSSPWTSLELPFGSKLVGVRLQGDTNTNQWTSALSYADISVAGLSKALLDGEPQYANTDANSAVDHWLIDSKDVRTLRIDPLTWENGASLRAGLWVVDTVATINDNPLLSDADGDGLNMLQEQAFGLDSGNSDSDGDGLSDGQEIALGANPSANDSDNDGLDDRIEQLVGTDPSDDSSPGLGNNQDPDNDGLTTAFELVVLQTDPTISDSDGDGLNDQEEIQLTFTDPLDADSDDDTLSDFEESSFGSNANLASSPTANPTLDSDDDGLNNAREVFSGTDPDLRDTDNDGLIDGQEFSLSSDPLDGDSPVLDGATDNDGDGLSAASEFLVSSDPEDEHDPLTFGSQDLDGDNLPNAADPDYLETGDDDGDGVANQLEYDTASDPRDGDSPTLGGASDRDGDGEANGVDSDFVFLVSDDSDNDGLTDSQEFVSGSNADDSNSPLTAGGEDIDTDSVVNNVDVNYDGLDDDDADGWSNSFEYRSGTDPAVANIASDFSDPVITRDSAADSLLQVYSLPAQSTGAPYYAANPHDLPSVNIVSTSALESARDSHAGFDGDDISYAVQGGDAKLLNNTARRFKNIALRNSATGEVTRVLGEIRPFSEVTLSALVSNATVIEPNPFGKLQLSELQSYNDVDDSQRVEDTLIDDFQRLAIGHKLHLNHPDYWQSFSTNSASGCISETCSSTTAASETLARLLYQERELSLALLNPSSEYSRLSWHDKLAIKSNSLDSYEIYQQAQSLSLGLSKQSGLLDDLSDEMDTSGNYSLTTAQSVAKTWTEQGAYYTYTTDESSNEIRLSVFNAQDIAKILAFSETPATAFDSLGYDAATGEFVFVLSDNQWDTGRLAVALQNTDGEALTAISLSWSTTEPVATWTDETLACAAGATTPCHD